MGKDKTQTTTQTLDPSSQQYVDQMRQRSQGYAADTMGGGPLFAGPDGRSIEEIMKPFMDPYLSQVIQGVRGDATRQRGMASREATDAAIRAGAAGGSRHGVAEGIRLGEIDRNELQTVGGLMSSGFQNAMQTGIQQSEYQRALRERMLQEPLFRRQMSQGFYTGGMGPVGQQQTQVTEGNLLADVAGLGMTAAGMFMGGPAGAAAAGGLFGKGTQAGASASKYMQQPMQWYSPFSLRPNHPGGY